MLQQVVSRTALPLIRHPQFALANQMELLFTRLLRSRDFLNILLTHLLVIAFVDHLHRHFPLGFLFDLVRGNLTSHVS